MWGFHPELPERGLGLSLTAGGQCQGHPVWLVAHTECWFCSRAAGDTKCKQAAQSEPGRAQRVEGRERRVCQSGDSVQPLLSPRGLFFFCLWKVGSCFALTLCTNTSPTRSWFYKVTAVSKETDSGQRGVVLRGDWQSHPRDPVVV